jgi:hypothetical protein
MMHCLILKLAVLGILSVQASPIELNHHMQGSTTLVDKNDADLQLSRSKNCNLNDLLGTLFGLPLAYSNGTSPVLLLDGHARTPFDGAQNSAGSPRPTLCSSQLPLNDIIITDLPSP